MINIVNQIFEIEQKISAKGDGSDIGRNVERLKNHLSELGLIYHVPLNEKYHDTRTDCVANIVGELHEDKMYITKVIKPVIFQQDTTTGQRSIVQKAVVIVEARS